MRLTANRFLGPLVLALTVSIPALAIPEPVAQLAETLGSRMEAHLKESLQRSEVGFKVTPKQAGKTILLTVPSYIQREMIFDVLVEQAVPPVVKGKVLTPEQAAVVQQAAQAALGPDVKVQVGSHPYSDVGKDYGILTKPSSDLYVEPMAQAGENLATQSRLGTPVKILAYDSSKKFARVLNEDDGYIAWILRQNLRETEAKEYQDWKKHRRVILLKNLAQPPLYFGTQLKLVSRQGAQIVAALPDGKPVTLKQGQAFVLSQRSGNMQALLETARQFLPKGPQSSGPYLWGGTIGNRLDCSGFVQTVYRAHQTFLPRDADQQKKFSLPVALTLGAIDELKPGDLVFFSGNRQYATHVGIYIGHSEFIHSSPKGPYSGIKISTLKGGGEYDKYLQGIYFGGGRISKSLW